MNGRLVARNTLLNFAGQVVPLAVGVVSLPFIVRGLGADRFGVLSLAWIVIGYFGFLDLGLGRATTKFMAEILGRGDTHRVSGLFWISLAYHSVLGLGGGLLLAALTPFLVQQGFNLPAALIPEARQCFFILAAAVPLVVIMASVRGALEAAQRFDLVNAVRVPSSALTFLLPLAGVTVGASLPSIVLWLTLAKLGTTLVMFILCFTAFPSLGRTPSFDRTFRKDLLSFGGWTTVTNVIGPTLTYLDRFLVGSLLTMTLLTYYTAPYEGATRLLIFPASLTMTLFPAFSALGRERPDQLGRLFLESLRWLVIAMTPLVLAVCVLSGPILRLWLGADFAANSTRVLQLLAVATFFNSLAQIPSNFLQGLGRPDISAKLILVELPLYAAGAWFAIHRWGIVGAAAAGTVRVILDTGLHFAAAWKLFPFTVPSALRNGLLNARTGP